MNPPEDNPADEAEPIEAETAAADLPEDPAEDSEPAIAEPPAAADPVPEDPAGVLPEPPPAEDEPELTAYAFDWAEGPGHVPQVVRDIFGENLLEGVTACELNGGPGIAAAIVHLSTLGFKLETDLAPPAGVGVCARLGDHRVEIWA